VKECLPAIDGNLRLSFFSLYTSSEKVQNLLIKHMQRRFRNKQYHVIICIK